jgi:hypothetical protein
MATDKERDAVLLQHGLGSESLVRRCAAGAAETHRPSGLLENFQAPGACLSNKAARIERLKGVFDNYIGPVQGVSPNTLDM